MLTPVLENKESVQEKCVHVTVCGNTSKERMFLVESRNKAETTGKTLY